MKDKISLNENDKERAVKKLKYFLEFDEDPSTVSYKLRRVLEQQIPGCIEAYAQIHNAVQDNEIDVDSEESYVDIDDEDIPRFVVDILDVELLKNKEIRHSMFDGFFKKYPNQIKFLVRKYNEKDKKTPEQLHKMTKKQNWMTGGSHERRIAIQLGFPPIYSGLPSSSKPMATESVEFRPKLRNLEDFQKNIKDQLSPILNKREGHNNRCIIRLPTGAGKTRIIVEAALDFWKLQNERQFILWIAHNTELCEQALECFRQIWEEDGKKDTTLQIFRVFASRSIPTSDEGGVIIAGIDQLTEIAKTDRNNLEGIKNLIGMVIVDEAHRSTSKSYVEVFDALSIDHVPTERDQCPVIGLTATPFRSKESGTKKLERMYDNNIIHPSGEGFQDWDDFEVMTEKLTGLEILSTPKYEILDSHVDFDLDDTAAKTYEEKNQLSDKFLKSIGDDRTRNIAVFKRIQKLVNDGKQVLFFGASVNQAILMSKLLNDTGIKSAEITSDTQRGPRSSNIMRFKRSEVKVLCNYQVLTTGFDAPKIDAVVIARPTASRTLFTQMEGRGMRGPKFGGTKRCDIITVVDNIYRFNDRIRLIADEYAEKYRNISSEEGA